MNLSDEQTAKIKLALINAKNDLLNTAVETKTMKAQMQIDGAVLEIMTAIRVIEDVEKERERILEATKKRDARIEAAAERWRTASLQLRYLEAQNPPSKEQKETLQAAITQKKAEVEHYLKEWTSI